MLFGTDTTNRLGVAAAAMVILAGCATGPAYVKPTVEVPTAFKETTVISAPQALAPDGWKSAAPQDRDDRGAWWEIFDEPSLNQLESRVTVSNQTIQKAVATRNEARAEVGAARAGYFPSINALIEPARSLTSQNVLGRSLAGQTVSDYYAGLDVSWEPDLFGKVGHGVDAATARAQASAADLASVELSMHADLAVDYFDLRGVDSQTALLQQTVVAYQAALDIATRRFDVGIASDSDVALAQTQLQTTRAQLIDLGVIRAHLEHAIATLIGAPASRFTLEASATQLAPPNIPAGVPSLLLQRRPDIAAAERRVAASNSDIGEATSAFFPDLLLSAAGGFESSFLSPWLSLPSSFWAVAAPLTGTLFDGGRRRQTLKGVQAQYQAAVADYRQVVLTSFQQVEDDLASLRILADEAQTQQDAVSSAARALELATNRYKGGAVGYLDVVTAQSSALTNQRVAIEISQRRLDASVLLVKALGGLWDTPERGRAINRGSRPES